MSKIDQLCESYGKFIAVPWREDVAAAQRVIFCVYKGSDELRLRVKIDEFKLATRKAGHDWNLFDLTNTFADWLSAQKYAERYYKQPGHLQILPRYLDHIQSQFEVFLAEKKVTANSVVAVQGVGTLFGLLKVKQVVDVLAPLVAGRLVFFFPGTFEGNNYRLLDGYDGWNYLAVAITADKDI